MLNKERIPLLVVENVKGLNTCTELSYQGLVSGICGITSY